MNGKKVVISIRPEIVEKIYQIKDDLSKGKDLTSKIQELVELLSNLVTSRGEDFHILIITFPIFDEQEKKYFILPPYTPYIPSNLSNVISNKVKEFTEKIKKGELLPIIELFKDVPFPYLHSFCIDVVNNAYEDLLDNIIEDIKNYYGVNFNVTDDVKRKISRTIEFLSQLSNDILNYIQKNETKKNSYNLISYFLSKILNYIQKNETKKRFIFIIPITLGIPPHSFVVGIIYCDPNTINDKLSEISLLAYSTFYPLHYLIKNVLFLRYALRSAVAAIMARNMSHNIGSHVLAYYEQGLKEIDCEGQPLDDARERFNRYLQARMDYIAYVTTITPSYGVGFILEEVINEFNENKILVKGLAASENFKEVKINLVNDDSTYRDLLSFPMGELGKHALFNIFEGIARNTAKHGYPQGGSGTLQIHVKPVDKGEFVELEIWDDAKSYEKAKIALNLDGDKEKDARYHKFIDDTGALQSEFWGIKEMRVGSLFLKKIPLTKIQDDEILAIDCKNKEGSLCYVLNMYKFKYLLIVSNKVKEFQRGRYIDMVNTEKLNELGKTEYKLCVIDQEKTLSLEEEMNLPLRRIYDNIDDKKLVLSNNEENEKELVLEYYDKWLEERCRLNSTEIIYSPLDDKVIAETKDKWKNITVRKIDPCTEVLENKIIFAGHLIKSSIKCEGKDEQSYVQACLSKDTLFIQDVSGKTQYLKTTLNNPPDDDFKKWIFVYEIKEAACEPVIIFDERLWKRYKEEKDYTEYLQKGQNIIFANLKSDNKRKEEIEFKDLKEQTVLTIKKQDSNVLSIEWKNSKKYTFACFHLGIIEKISEIFNVGVSFVIENLSKNQKNTFEHLIIHTGRGKTLKYDEPLLYMDLTSLQRGVEEGKIYLIQTLYSLKPTERG